MLRGCFRTGSYGDDMDGSKAQAPDKAAARTHAFMVRNWIELSECLRYVRVGSLELLAPPINVEGGVLERLGQNNVMGVPSAFVLSRLLN